MKARLTAKRRKFPSTSALSERYPDCRFWLDRGIFYREALILTSLGLKRAEDLEGWTRERFLEQRGLGPTTLQKVEKGIGRKLPSSQPAPYVDHEVDPEGNQQTPLHASQWRFLGFGTNTAAALAARGYSIRDLKNLKREEFEAIRQVGPYSVSLCQRLFGIWPNEEPEAVHEPVPDEEPR